MRGGDTSAFLTREETGAAIVAFSRTQKAAIKAASLYFAARSGIPPDDLINSAVERLLSNAYPRDCDLLKKFIGAMRSIASGKDSRRKSRIDYVDPEDLTGATHSAWWSSALAEGEVLSALDIERLSKIIEDLLKDRPLIKKIYDGRKQGLNGEQLRIYAGITQKQLEAAIKALTRMLARLKDGYDDPQV